MTTATPPPEQDHEAILLGGLLTGRVRPADVPLAVEDFAHPRHRALFEIINATAGGPVTQLRVIDAIGKHTDSARILRLVGGAPGIARIAEAADQFGVLTWHIQAITQAARTRRVRADIDRLNQGIRSVEDGRAELLDLRALLDRITDSITPPDGDRNPTTGLATVHQITTQPAETRPQRPQLGADAYHGLAGEVALALDPYTEADPAAVLLQFAAAAGCYIGRSPHMSAGESPHTARLWPLIIGWTSTGAKGTSWAATNRVITAASPQFARSNIAGGLSTGEGLIELVRDPGEIDAEGNVLDAGVADKRLIVLEEEFASVLARMRRDGNTLSSTLRLAWDGKTLSTLTRKINRLTATGPHIVVIAHVVPGELRAKMADSDVAGGLFNRFIPVYSERSKLLPDGGGAPDDLVDDLAAHLRDVAGRTRHGRAMTRTAAGRDYWHDLYPTLVSCDDQNSLVEQLTARAKAQVLRLSVAYALLDGALAVDEVHIRAAHAVWQYALDTVRYVWSGTSADPDLDRLVEFVNQNPGCTRTQVSGDLFRHHLGKSRLDELFAALVELPDYEEVRAPTKGRPALRYWRKSDRRPA